MVGTIGVWENNSFTSLANWYYELGFDQHSQVANPDFVAPAGADGVLGFGTTTGPIDFNSAGYTFNLPNFDTPFSVPIQQLNSIGAVAAGTLQLTGTWTPVYDTANASLTSPTPGTVVTTSGTVVTTTVTKVTYAFETNGFDGNAAFTYNAPLANIPLLYETATGGSASTATWTFTGLIPGQTYQINTINEAGSQFGTADFVATDNNGNVLTAAD